MKHTVRAFALGLIVAGAILLAVFYLQDDPAEDIENMATEELVTRVEEEGLRVITEEEYISFSVDRAEDKNTEEEQEEPENDEDEDAEAEAENEETDEEDDTPSTVTITIEPGMPSSSIGDLLEEEGLIDDAGEFNDYLVEHDYSLYVRMGDHELETGMSHYEIAEALTN